MRHLITAMCLLVLSLPATAQDVRTATASVSGMTAQLGGYWGARFGQSSIAQHCEGGWIDNGGVGGTDTRMLLNSRVCPDCVLAGNILLDSYINGGSVQVRYYEVPNQPGECRFAPGGVRYALSGGDGEPTPGVVVPDNPRCDLDPVSWAGCWVDWWAVHGTGDPIPVDPACMDDALCWSEWWLAL